MLIFLVFTLAGFERGAESSQSGCGGDEPRAAGQSERAAGGETGKRVVADAEGFDREDKNAT